MALSKPGRLLPLCHRVEKTQNQQGQTPHAEVSCVGFVAYKNKMVMASSQPKQPIGSSGAVNGGAGGSESLLYHTEWSSRFLNFHWQTGCLHSWAAECFNFELEVIFMN